MLAVARTAEELAEKHGIEPGEMRRRLDAALQQMRAFRELRARPGLDDKVLTGWNGLMLSALASAGKTLSEPRYIDAANKLVEFLFSRHWSGEKGGRLLRVSRRGGPAHTDAFLDDHAFLLNGLLDLSDATAANDPGRTALIQRAVDLAEILIRNFADDAHSGFFFTGPRHERLFARMKNAADNATPSANGVTIRALLRLARETGEERFRHVALNAVRAFAENIERRPEFFPTILLALLEDGAKTAQSGDSRVRVELQPVAVSAGGEGLLKLHVDPLAPAKPGAQIEIVARLIIAPGYHVQSWQPQDRGAIATVARLRSLTEPAIIATQTWNYPPDAEVDGGSGYAGTVELRARCLVSQSAPPGAHALRVIVEAQPCSGSACLPVQTASAEIALQIQG